MKRIKQLRYNIMNITNEDLELIRKFQDILKRGYYADGKQVTDLHNKILGTRLNSTNCGACIRTRIQALVDAADKFERMIQLDSIKEDENKAADEAKNEDMKARMAKVRAHRKQNK